MQQVGLSRVCAGLGRACSKRPWMADFSSSQLRSRSRTTVRRRLFGGLATQQAVREEPVPSTSKIPYSPSPAPSLSSSNVSFTPPTPSPSSSPPPHSVSAVLSALRELRSAPSRAAEKKQRIGRSLKDAPIPPPPPLPPPPLYSTHVPRQHILSALLLHAVLLGFSALSLLRQQAATITTQREAMEDRATQSQIELNLILSSYSPLADEPEGELWDRNLALNGILQVMRRIDQAQHTEPADRWTVLALLAFITEPPSISTTLSNAPSSPTFPYPSPTSPQFSTPIPSPPPPLPPPPLSKYHLSRPLIGHWAWKKFTELPASPRDPFPPETTSLILAHLLDLVLTFPTSQFVHDVLKGFSLRVSEFDSSQIDTLLSASIQHQHFPLLLALIDPDSSFTPSQRISTSITALSLLSSHPRLRSSTGWVKPVAEALSAAVRQSVGSKIRRWPGERSPKPKPTLPTASNTSHELAVEETRSSSMKKKLAKRMRRLAATLHAEKTARRALATKGRTRGLRRNRMNNGRVIQWWDRKSKIEESNRLQAPAKPFVEKFRSNFVVKRAKEGVSCSEADVENVKKGLLLLMQSFALDEPLENIYADITQTLIIFNRDHLSNAFISQVLTALVKARHDRLALDLFDSLPRSSLTIDLYRPFLASSISRVSTALWYDLRYFSRMRPRLDSYSARLSSFAKNGELGQATALWREMASFKIIPGRREWNKWLWLIAEKGGPRALTRCWTRMRRSSGVGVDEASLAAMVRSTHRRWMAGTRQVRRVRNIVAKSGVEVGLVVKNMALKTLIHWRTDLSEEQVLKLAQDPVKDKAGRRIITRALRKRGASVEWRRAVMNSR